MDNLVFTLIYTNYLLLIKIEFEMPFVTLLRIIQYDGFDSLLCLENGSYFSLHFNEIQISYLKQVIK
jgi:hypothetical protein